MKRSGRIAAGMLALGLLLSVGAGVAHAQTYADAQGFYADFGVGLGWNNLAGPFEPVDNGTMVGFVFAGGYRFNPWVAAEGEFFWLGGGELTNAATVQRVNSSITSLGFAARFYPLALAPDLIPQWIQPNLILGIGTGLAEFASTAPFTFDSQSRTVLLTRLGIGIDVMLTKHWGATIDGNYFVTNNDALTGIGTLKLGVLCRF